MTGVFIRRENFGHKLIQREDDLKTQGGRQPSTSQGERPGAVPSLWLSKGISSPNTLILKLNRTLWDLLALFGTLRAPHVLK